MLAVAWDPLALTAGSSAVVVRNSQVVTLGSQAAELGSQAAELGSQAVASQAATPCSQVVVLGSQAVALASQVVTPCSQAVALASQTVALCSQAVAPSSQAVVPSSQTAVLVLAGGWEVVLSAVNAHALALCPLQEPLKGLALAVGQWIALAAIAALAPCSHPLQNSPQTKHQPRSLVPQRGPPICHPNRSGKGRGSSR
ncbi:hypothetical protein EOD39_8309 [Acipenser ruthenus]|uniref:Uncharacterized protein n=1 Tax=Acipenser ruthenus TaxID=7906 RepID=A0A662YZG7_ACIRT|nr:hypothetical protein EOD39_8309 [Acipenser ruthenus]